MDIFEELVMRRLTREGHIFLCPQYSISYELGSEWSCPDFVALDFREKIVSVVEVSTAFNVSDLAKKVKEREKQWLEKLKAQLENNRVVDMNWSYRVDAFVRSDARPDLRTLFKGQADVEIHLLDEVTFPWVGNLRVKAAGS